MPNLDAANGFQAVGHYTGGEIRTERRKVTASAEIFGGDVLKAVAGGTVEEAAADIGLAAIGVASNYVLAAASGDYWCDVWEDPYIIYSAQTDTGTASTAADIFVTANHVAGTGSTTTKMSGHELDSSQMAASGGAQFKVLGLDPTPGNAWGEHSRVLVMFNEHWAKAAVVGI
jgi:hypothetical protein